MSDTLTDDIATIRESLNNAAGSFTLGDIAEQTGLSFVRAEKALFALLKVHPGSVGATDKGELLFDFPKGVHVKRPEQTPWYRFKTWASNTWDTLTRTALRVWISVVMVFYALAFLAIIIGAFVAAQNNDSDVDVDLGDVLGGVFRVIMEAFYWSYHPFSPFNSYGYGRRRYGKKVKEGPSFYEKVNRFVFGPPKDEAKAELLEAVLISQIRSNAGLMTLSRAMSHTMLSRESTKVLLADLMVKYDGEVSVSEKGGIVYVFESLARKAQGETQQKPDTIRFNPKESVITGNTSLDNFKIGALNAFNWLSSLAILAGGIGSVELSPLMTLIFGAIPFVFSSYIFMKPLTRWFRKRKQSMLDGAYNLKLELLNFLSSDKVREKMTATSLEDVEFTRAAIEQVASKVLPGDLSDKDHQSIIEDALGELQAKATIKESGALHYVFRDLEAEVEALEEERKKALENKVHDVGEVVYQA